MTFVAPGYCRNGPGLVDEGRPGSHSGGSVVGGPEEATASCEAPAGHALPSINQVTLSLVYVLALEVEHVDSEERLSEFPHISLLFSVYRGLSLKG